MNFHLGTLSRLGLAGAYALQGNHERARTAYEEFFALWKDADPDIPIFKQARSCPSRRLLAQESVEGFSALSKTQMGTYQFKITLLETRPPIWRRVLVPSDITLRTLHRTAQTAMGWTDSHVHQFVFKGQKYSDPKYQLGVGITDERKTRLCEVSSTVGDRFLYQYDFGDDWRHELRLEQVLDQNDSFWPICVAGERACPPEDCGGSLGYAELLEIVANPDHPEYDDRLEWLGGDFDPECFDLAEVNRKLMRSNR